MSFTHNVIVASITMPVLGFDFLAKFQLDLKWHGQKCRLHKDNRSIQLHLATVSNDLLGLAEVGADFKSWSESHKVSEPHSANDIPPAYAKMLDELPGIDTPDFKTIPAHAVVHHIDTGHHPHAAQKFAHSFLEAQKRSRAKQNG